MDYSETYATLREMCGNPSKDEYGDYNFERALRAGLEQLNRRVGFYANDDSGTLALVAGQNEYELQPDVVQIVWVELGTVRLQRSDQDEWRRRNIQWDAAPAGAPTEYAHWTNRIILYPKPDSATVSATPTLTLRYIAAHPGNIPASGFQKLNLQDQRVALYAAAAEFTRHHGTVIYGDPNVAQMKVQQLEKVFESEASIIAKQYESRMMRR